MEAVVPRLSPPPPDVEVIRLRNVVEFRFKRLVSRGAIGDGCREYPFSAAIAFTAE